VPTQSASNATPQPNSDKEAIQLPLPMKREPREVRAGFKLLVARRDGQFIGPFSDFDKYPPPMKWTGIVEHPQMCERGWHAYYRLADAQRRLASCTLYQLWIVEVEGPFDDTNHRVSNQDKFCGRRLRFIKKLSESKDKSMYSYIEGLKEKGRSIHVK
jgi:hypothetical protein